MKTANKQVDGSAAVEAYLAAVSEPARSTLQSVRERIRAAAPRAATETISYGMPAFRHNGVLVSYAAFKKHCSFFPMGSSVLDALGDEVKPYRMAKGTLQFPLDKPLPATLIRKIVKARLAQTSAKKPSSPAISHRTVKAITDLKSS